MQQLNSPVQTHPGLVASSLGECRVSLVRVVMQPDTKHAILAQSEKCGLAGQSSQRLNKLTD